MTQNAIPSSPVATTLPERRGIPASAPQRIGHIVSVSGSQAIAVLDRPVGDVKSSRDPRIQIGALMKITTPNSSVVGLISAVSSPTPTMEAGSPEIGLIEINLAGELVIDPTTKRLAFRRGVACLPSLGDPILFADRHDLTRVYAQPNVASIKVGSLYQDAAVPARLLIDELLSKHFIVVGTTGCGKSSALTCILQRVLSEHHYAHIVVLDVHNEYPAAFGEQAELIDPSNLHLPIWLLNFQELTEALTSSDAHRDAETEILGDGVVNAKRRFLDASTVRSTTLARRTSENGSVTVDTPTPYRLSDVVAYIDEQLGKLDRTQSTVPYRRLKSRIETLVSDQRYGFMFGSLTIQDTMTETLGRLFRVPSEGRPITVINLSTVPSEILDVVISVISRLAFDLAVWSKGGLPMLLVCEEAHRYAPAGPDEKFAPTRQALSRIAKEGRKYGLSLALVTQRPSELDPTVLSQCSTAIAMRLSTEKDQSVMRANTHDGALDLLDFLPLLGDREAIAFGQGVAMPMRIRFDDLGAQKGTPENRIVGFSEQWKSPNMDREQLEAIIARWRLSGRERG
ncbi:MAG: DUF87 domain-containing protein [Parvibaculum sp.]|jgi:DNA helicase HerA-like ATPase|uniref:ATP-binding protein n=1 Tax=Parvibaculum sp. TaxID=2024848 RepID=UPI0028416F4A|nr:DUF87 domain-containing protein [Parvibaculum sp.]MDR3500224.1 DUF87 domain-containing protein [Parvibaculum sp.]